MDQSKFKAYFDDPSLKNKYCNRMEDHIKKGDFIPSLIWKNGRGNHIGCTVHSYEHEVYSEQTGIPSNLGLIVDYLCNQLDLSEASKLSLGFLKRIRVGANLNNIWRKLSFWSLCQQSIDDSCPEISQFKSLYKESTMSEVSFDKWKSLHKKLNVIISTVHRSPTKLILLAASHYCYAEMLWKKPLKNQDRESFSTQPLMCLLITEKEGIRFQETASKVLKLVETC